MDRAPSNEVLPVCMGGVPRQRVPETGRSIGCADGLIRPLGGIAALGAEPSGPDGGPPETILPSPPAIPHPRRPERVPEDIGVDLGP
ncbi:MAG TPA: hypothetical protein VLE99_04305 [Candidatus Saccharimonadales bacterium]|nr:hypothetical protein [Candidatus Saccharimonadales bacterium]